jgi:uncharacterized protein
MRVDPPGKLALGLGTGMAFGALLQRGRLGRYDVIMDQLLLRDGTVGKTMATAVVVGAAGVQALVARGRARLEVKPLQPVAVLGGAVLFGAGLALIGYCPGTSMAAIGEGRRDAIAGALGMLAGAAVYVRTYPRLAPMLEAGDRGKVTLPRATRTSPWPWIAALGVALVSWSIVTRVRRA